jgi:AcrR family transcriptional regulator
MDPRQRRSRAQLHATILRLATDKPVTELSVTEVAEAAGVHRSTFYQHATSPAALLEDALLADLDELRTGLEPDGAERDIVTTVGAVTEGVLRHVERYLAIYRRGLGAESGEASLHPMLSRHFRDSGRQLLDRPDVRIDVQVPGFGAAAVADGATRFIADGTVGLLEGWVQQPAPDVEGFLRLYAGLLPLWWPGARHAPS